MKSTLIVFTLICALTATEIGLTIEDHGFLLNWITVIPSVSNTLGGGHTLSTVFDRKYYVFAGYYKSLKANTLTPQLNVDFSFEQKQQPLQLKTSTDDSLVYTPMDTHLTCAPNQPMAVTAIDCEVAGNILKVNIKLLCTKVDFQTGVQQFTADKINDATGLKVGEDLTNAAKKQILTNLFRNIV